MATWKHLVITVWRSRVQARMIEVLGKALAGVSKSESLGMFAVIEGDWSLPGEEERAAFARVLQTTPMAFSAAVFEGTNPFYLAALSAVVTSVAHLMRRSVRSRVFGSVEAAATWCVQEDPRVGDPASLLAALRAIRSTRGNIA